MTDTLVEVDGVTYEMVPQPVRTSLSDSPAMLWGLQVHVLRDGELVGIKTCFVGRVSVHTRDPEVADAPLEILLPVLHDLALGAVRKRLEEGDATDEIVFA